MRGGGKSGTDDLWKESREFLSPESASARRVMLVVGCCAGPWGKPSTLSGAELAVTAFQDLEADSGQITLMPSRGMPSYSDLCN